MDNRTQPNPHHRKTDATDSGETHPTESEVHVTGTPTRDLLRGRFGWFFLGRSVDLAGSSMTTIALALAVLQTSGSAADLGIILAAGMMPTLALLLLGGTVADRFSRRQLLISSNAVSAVVMATMASLFLTDRYSLTAIAGLAFVNGVVEAFNSPALRGIVPELVAPGDLQRANALLASTQSAMRILGPALGSVLVAVGGGGWALAVDAATYAVAALLFTRIPGGVRPAGTGQPLWRDLAEGWGTFWSMRWVVVMAVSFACINAVNVGPWNVLGPQIVTEHDGALGWGAVQAARAAGLLVMSLLAVRIILRRPLRDGRLWGVLGALPLLALGSSGQAWVVATAAFVGGLGLAIAGITWESTLQASVPPDRLSRVASYDDLLSYLVIPVSQIAAGSLAGVVDARTVCTVCGVGYAVASLLPLLNRHIRTHVADPA